jgi:hypothetical protein
MLKTIALIAAFIAFVVATWVSPDDYAPRPCMSGSSEALLTSCGRVAAR